MRVTQHQTPTTSWGRSTTWGRRDTTWGRRPVTTWGRLT